MIAKPARDGGGWTAPADRGTNGSVLGIRELQCQDPLPCCGTERRTAHPRLSFALHTRVVPWLMLHP
jgi:hypothetical protein